MDYDLLERVNILISQGNSIRKSCEIVATETGKKWNSIRQAYIRSKNVATLQNVATKCSRNVATNIGNVATQCSHPKRSISLENSDIDTHKDVATYSQNVATNKENVATPATNVSTKCSHYQKCSHPNVAICSHPNKNVATNVSTVVQQEDLYLDGGNWHYIYEY